MPLSAGAAVPWETLHVVSGATFGSGYRLHSRPNRAGTIADHRGQVKIISENPFSYWPTNSPYPGSPSHRCRKRAAFLLAARTKMIRPAAWSVTAEKMPGSFIPTEPGTGCSMPAAPPAVSRKASPSQPPPSTFPSVAAGRVCRIRTPTRAQRPAPQTGLARRCQNQGQRHRGSTGRRRGCGL